MICFWILVLDFFQDLDCWILDFVLFLGLDWNWILNAGLFVRIWTCWIWTFWTFLQDLDLLGFGFSGLFCRILFRFDRDTKMFKIASFPAVIRSSGLFLRRLVAIYRFSVFAPFVLLEVLNWGRRSSPRCRYDARGVLCVVAPWR